MLLGCSDGTDFEQPSPPPASGLDSRPSNTTCIAPERDPVVARVETPRTFPNLRFSSPVALERAPGETSRWFVVEQGGRVRAFDAAASVAAAQDFVDVSRRVHFSGEAGLLGLAFHPDFSANGRAYLHYVASEGGLFRSVTSEFSSPDGGLTLDPGSERILLAVAKKSAGRNGGGLAFGPDGYLYVGLGDDGGTSAGSSRSLLGKMLRIDVDARPGGAAYGIPSGPRGNPYAGNPRCSAEGAGARSCPEIFALGLGDPRRASFDRRTGTLWVGDAGRPTTAAFRRLELGGNYAGGKTTSGDTGRGSDAAVGGGLVYRGKRAGALAGQFIFGDRTGMIATLRPDGNGGYSIAPLIEPGATPPGAPGPLQISAIAEDVSGELFFLDYGRGHVRRLVFADVQGGDNVPHTLSETGCVNTTASGAPPLLSLIPFRPNAALWSDGAVKDRWFALPDARNIAVQDDGDWDLPEGTVVVKHFRLGDRLVETRLFMRHPDGGWAGYTYQWNMEETEATRVTGGLTVPAGGQQYTFPSEADCLWCHNSAAGFTLGPETAQLNGSILYPQTGRSANQLATLDAIGTLSPPLDADPPAYADHADASATLEARARAYLHINCSICHRPGGPTPAAIDLRHDTPLRDTGACDAVPALGDLGIPDARIIAAGDSARSELLSRMSRRDAFKMPPLASNYADADGVALVAAWIDSLDAADCL
jgi:uncharacterized repeat protein (TIGR03806 family)